MCACIVSVCVCVSVCVSVCVLLCVSQSLSLLCRFMRNIQPKNYCREMTNKTHNTDPSVSLTRLSLLPICLSYPFVSLTRLSLLPVFLQSDRMDDQRCSLPDIDDVVQEDFFSLVQRVQSRRIDEQRASLQTHTADSTHHHHHNHHRHHQ